MPTSLSDSAYSSGSAAWGIRPEKFRARARSSEATYASATPTPPAPDMKGSHTLSVEATATAASNALPPAIIIRAPASDARGCAEVAMPLAPIAAGLFA